MGSFAEQLSGAIAAHGQWKVRLRQAIATGSSEFDPSVVAQDNQCAFGKWLYAGSKDGFGSAAAYETVRGLHADFHREAARVLALAVAGKAADASKAMDPGSPFAKASATLVSTLMQQQRAAA